MSLKILEVDEEKLEIWIKENFDSYKRSKKDFLVNSIFKKDKKYKLSISYEKQCYHCWKTDNSGPLWKLICQIENCDKKTAFQKVYKNNYTCAEYNNVIDKLKNNLQKKQIIKKNIAKNKFIKYFRFITLNDKHKYNIESLKYCIKKRKIDPIKWNFGYCYYGKYNKRLILPCMDQNNEIIYWTARALYDNIQPKYLNPNDKEVNSGTSNIIFTNNWNFKNKSIIVVEGIFDAIALIECGFHAIALLGKIMTQEKFDIIKFCGEIIWGLDNDKPGMEAIFNNCQLLEKNGFKNNKYVVSPYKNLDWSDIYTKEKKDDIKDFIYNNIKNVNLKELVKIKLNNKF